MPFGSWPDLVKWGGLGVWHHVLVQRRGRKTASFLWGNFSISHSEVLVLPISPKEAKSLNSSKSVDMICGYTSPSLA
jgi:hypothetical protein